MASKWPQSFPKVVLVFARHEIFPMDIGEDGVSVGSCGNQSQMMIEIENDSVIAIINKMYSAFH